MIIRFFIKGIGKDMEENYNEDSLEQRMMKVAEEKHIPMNGSIELLPLCNMNCDMCYVKLTKEEMDQQGRLRTLDEWLSVAKEMQKAGVLFLLLTGGEPLLYPEFKTLYVELRKLGFLITINTNGTLIDEEWAEFFGKYPPRRINITLYGANKDAYTNLCHYPLGFDKVINAVKLLRMNQVDVKLASSITKSNSNDIEELYEIANQLEVPLFCDTYMMPATRERKLPFCEQSRLHPKDAAKARIRSFKNTMEPVAFQQFIDKSIFEVENILPLDGPNCMSCHAGKCSFTINWQGNMRACVIMAKPERSVFDYGFKNAWEYIVEECSKIRLSSECLTCKYRTLCRTCAASELYEEGSYGRTPKYMCEYAKSSYEYLIEEKEDRNGNE